jgi:hypothetical protein
MKTISTLAILALSADAAIIKRQGHDHSSMAGMGDMGGMGKGMAGMGKIDGIDIKAILKSLGGSGGLGGLGKMMKPEVRKAFKIEKMKPQVRPEATRLRITYGPYKIRASGVSLFHVQS